MPNTTPNPPSVWQWVVLSFGLVAALALLAAHAPPGWQRPGPTALLFAVAAGIVIGGTAAVNGIRNPWLVFPVAFVFISLAIAGMTAERYRVYVNSLEELYLGSLESSVDPFSPVPKSEFLPARQEKFVSERPFSFYLGFRLRALGIETAPWPLVYWVGEILLGGLLGAFLAIRWQSWQLEANTDATA